MQDVITLNTLVVTALIATVLPIAVGVASKLNAASWLKSSLMLLFSAAEGFIIAHTQSDGSAVFTKEGLLLAVFAWVTAAAAHNNLLRPSGITEKVNTKTASFGIG